MEISILFLSISSVLSLINKTSMTKYLLVKDVLNLQRLDDVGDKLGVDVGVPDALVQQLTNCALVLRADLLWLVAHVQHWDRA
jgi:hypothetical protein